MNSKQATREKAAAFLDEIRTGVAEIIKQPGKGFDFSTYVAEYDYEHNCGTVCCMEGWVPSIRPDLAKWDSKYGFCVRVMDGILFTPQNVGIPISQKLWQALTMGGSQRFIGEADIKDDADFEEVAALWQRTAARIRAGELDHHLIFDHE